LTIFFIIQQLEKKLNNKYGNQTFLECVPKMPRNNSTQIVFTQLSAGRIKEAVDVLSLAFDEDPVLPFISTILDVVSLHIARSLAIWFARTYGLVKCM